MAGATGAGGVDTRADHGDFGELLRASRRTARVSQQQLADRVGLSMAAIRDLEQGRSRRPRREFVDAMVGALQLTGDAEAAFRDAADVRPAPPPPAGPLRVQILGPLTVTRGGFAVPMGRGRRRALLGRLALAANSTVPTADLIDLLWSSDPPSNPAQAVQNYLSRIRSALQPGVANQTIMVTRTPGGYQLHLGDDELDLADFRRRVRRARRAEPVEALAELEPALDLWRGNPLSDIPELLLHPLSIAVMDEYIAATLWHTDLALALGRADRGLPRLRELTAANPLHEPLHAHLMMVLAASGLQAAALTAYADIRRRLVDDLGIEPGPALVEAHRRVLRQEKVPGPRSTVDVPPPLDSERRPPPAQLPADSPAFAGRVAALAWLDGMLDTGQRASAVVVAALSGTAGVGKTALAVHWAHRVADRFPDGTLYLNLRGFDPFLKALDPAEAVRGFLDALGVSPARPSLGLDALVAEYRSAIRGRRMLVVLDNARDAEQVRPLLPGTSGAVVVLTSRNQLTGLVVANGARPYHLELMSPAESYELLVGRLGAERVHRDSQVAERIITLCTGLPLALAIVGARAQQTGFPLETVAAELGPAGRPLDALDGGDPMTRVRAVFSWSYRALAPAPARLFRLLGMHPGGEFGPTAAASLAGVAEAVVRDQLAELTRASLLAEPKPNRYALHDLLRAYATELAGEDESPERRQAAFARLVDHYLHTAIEADRKLSPSRRPCVIPLSDPAPRTTVGEIREPLAWFTAERPNLLAVLDRACDAGLATQAWQLAWAADSALELQGHWADFGTAWTLALSAASTLRDARANAYARRRLAYAFTLLARDGEADGHLSEAIRLYQEIGDLVGQSVVHHSLSHLYEQRHDLGRALHHAQRALACSEAAGDRGEQAAALNAIGWCHAQLGNHAEALAHCRKALRLIDPNNHRACADTWDSVGFACHHLGDFTEAAAAYRQALTLARQAGARHLEATVLTHLGDTHDAAGDHVAARDAWEPALDILVTIDSAAADQLRRRLAPQLS